MEDNRRYFVVTEKAVPDVLLKVVEAKRLLEVQKSATVQDAVEASADKDRKLQVDTTAG